MQSRCHGARVLVDGPGFSKLETQELGLHFLMESHISQNSSSDPKCILHKKLPFHCPSGKTKQKRAGKIKGKQIKTEKDNLMCNTKLIYISSATAEKSN